MPNMQSDQKITPFLWFDDNGEEAINLYLSIFNNSKIIDIQKNNGKMFSATFELDGQRFLALNGGPQFKFSEGISLFINCTTQEEVDRVRT